MRRVRQSFLFPLGRKTLELTINACVKPGLWSVAMELMERMQDESVTPETWLILLVGSRNVRYHMVLLQSLDFQECTALHGYMRSMSLKWQHVSIA